MDLIKKVDKYNFSSVREFFIDKYYRRCMKVSEIAEMLDETELAIRIALSMENLPLRKVDYETGKELD